MLDSQSAGWFSKRAQNHLPSQNTPTNSTWTTPQTVDSVSRVKRSVAFLSVASNFIDFYSFLTIRFLLVFFKETVFFCTIMLLFYKAILLWQHWWFFFLFWKSRWLDSKGLSNKMIVIQINFKIIFKAISHWKHFCFLRNSHVFFKAITL